MVNEARQALLLARVGRALSAPETVNGKTFFGCDLGQERRSASGDLEPDTGASAMGSALTAHCMRYAYSLFFGLALWGASAVIES